MSSKILFFTGAPESNSLSWNESSLLNGFNETVLQFAGLTGHTNTNPAVHEATASEHPSWRSIPLEKQHLTTGFSQDHGWQPEYQGTSFFTTSDITSLIEEESYIQTGGSFGPSTQSAEEVLSQFYEKSYAIHEDIPSSQIPADSSQQSASYYSYGTSFEATESYDSQCQSALQSFPRPTEIPVTPVVGRLHSLKEIPNATYLNSIQPQTMTVNLIVGIISLPAPRAIKTRHGAAVELVEVLAGDETKSGFAINFWLSSDRPAEGSLRGVLGALRPQDVILVRNVALSSFRGKVYGQSLRKEMTKVHLMYRNRLDRTDPGGCYTSEDISTGEAGNRQLEKTRSVRDWVFKFVGVAEGGRKTKGEAFEVAKEVLPPDTQ